MTCDLCLSRKPLGYRQVFRHVMDKSFKSLDAKERQWPEYLLHSKKPGQKFIHKKPKKPKKVK